MQEKFQKFFQNYNLTNLFKNTASYAYQMLSGEGAPSENTTEIFFEEEQQQLNDTTESDQDENKVKLFLKKKILYLFL